jgi:hypothetical protein
MVFRNQDSPHKSQCIINNVIYFVGRVSEHSLKGNDWRWFERKWSPAVAPKQLRIPSKNAFDLMDDLRSEKTIGLAQRFKALSEEPSILRQFKQPGSARANRCSMTNDMC